MIRRACFTLVLCLAPLAAFAQAEDPATLDLAASQTSQGPMIVERIHNGFLAAPDFKVTEVDHKTVGLAGGYAGFVFADAFFIGGGGYGTVTNDRDRDLAYGGLIMQWFGRTNETFGYGAKMLMGWGTSTSSDTVQVMSGGKVTNQVVRFRQDFGVFEPEVNALVRFSKHLRLTAGAGYRFTGSGHYGYYDYGYPDTHRSPSGAVGSIGLQIGGGG